MKWLKKNQKKREKKEKITNKKQQGFQAHTHNKQVKKQSKEDGDDQKKKQQQAQQKQKGKAGCLWWVVKLRKPPLPLSFRTAPWRHSSLDESECERDRMLETGQIKYTTMLQKEWKAQSNTANNNAKEVR